MVPARIGDEDPEHPSEYRPKRAPDSGGCWSGRRPTTTGGVVIEALKTPAHQTPGQVRTDAGLVARMVLQLQDLRDYSGGVGQNCYRYPPTDSVPIMLPYRVK